MTEGTLRILGSLLVGIGLLTVGLLMVLPPRRGVLSRLDDESSGRLSMDSFRSGVTRTALRTRLQDLRGSRKPKARTKSAASSKLMLAGLRVTPTEWKLVVAGSSILLGLLALLRFRSPVALPFGMAGGYLAPAVVLKIMRSRRSRSLDRQLAPFLQSLNSSLRAGLPFAVALAQVGAAARPPLGPEVQRATREIHLGVPIHTALDRLVNRNHLDELRLVVTALQIHAQLGGNLVEILDNIELTIRERVRIKGEIRILTSQARASGWVLGLLPVILGGLLFVIAPTYFGPMVSDPLGIGMLIAAAFLLVVGCVLIQKLAKVEY